MQKILVLALVVLQMGSYSWAQSLEDRRRVEEEKRMDLSSSEFYLPEAGEFGSSEVVPGQNAYFSRLITKEVADLSDAYQALVVLMGVDGQYPDTASQFDFLKGEGIIPKSVVQGSDHNTLLRKGAAAYMFAKTMGIKGGIILRIFGLSERYAFKEQVYQGIMYPGNVNDVMSGPELVLTLTQAADHMADRQTTMDTKKERWF